MYPPRGRALPRAPSYEAGLRPPRTPRFRRKARAFLQTGRFRWLRCYPPPYPLPRTHSSEGGRCAGAGGGVLFYRSHFKGGDGRQWRPSIADRGGSRDQAPPFGTPGGERKRGKIIYLFGDGVFGGKLLQSPKGDSCRGEGVNTGSRATLSALCPGGLTVAAVFFGKQKKSRRSLKDFLLRGGAGERRGFCFERTGAGKRGFWRYQKSRFITGITVPASHSA